MTVLAEPPPPLKRLFDRLDLAPQPKKEGLSRLLSNWSKKHGTAVAPPSDEFYADMLREAVAALFIFDLGATDDKYVLASHGRTRSSPRPLRRRSPPDQRSEKAHRRALE